MKSLKKYDDERENRVLRYLVYLLIGLITLMWIHFVWRVPFPHASREATIHARFELFAARRCVLHHDITITGRYRDLRVLCATFMLVLYLSLLQEQVKAPQWYERTVGIIGVPVAIVGLFYTFALIKKTRLESQKLSYEIQEKIRAQDEGKNDPQTAQDMFLNATKETLQNQLYAVLLLRYVALELTLFMFDLITTPISMLKTAVILGGFWLTKEMIHSGEGTQIGFAAANELIGWIISAARWLIIFALGWPLFRDVNTALGISLKQYHPKNLFRIARQQPP